MNKVNKMKKSNKMNKNGGGLWERVGKSVKWVLRRVCEGSREGCDKGLS